jgi:hypothetical protein
LFGLAPVLAETDPLRSDQAMTIVQRLRLLTLGLGATAAIAVVGSAVIGDARNNRSEASVVRATGPTSDELAKTKFTNQPTLSFASAAGDTVFAWQLKPTLAANPILARDVLVLVDTSASQAGEPLRRARDIIALLAKELGPDDRLNVWTANINHASATRSLTGGFQKANSDSVQLAVSKLSDTEYGSGAVDLKAAIEQSTKQFDRAGRNQVILYLGDGESAASPVAMTENGRVELGNQLADREIAFFAVPLGIKLHPNNLHGLAMSTGGTVVRLIQDLFTEKTRAEFATAIKSAIDAPILRPDRVSFSPANAEIYPTRLPPLRGDRATLVVGKVKNPIKTVAVRIEGRTLAGKQTVDASESLAAASGDNYFLHAMLSQWQGSTSKDTPALLSADRALAIAADQFRMFHDEYATQAVWAITADRLDHAEKLFDAAVKINPNSPEGIAGKALLAKVRSGQLAPVQVKASLNNGVKLSTALKDLNQDTPPAGGAKPAAQLPPPVAGGAAAGERDLIGQAKAAQKVVEDEARLLVDETIRRARRLLNTDPDAAQEDVKRQRENILANDQLSDAFRRKLVLDLETSLREIQLKGAEIKRQNSAERTRIAEARRRLNEFDRLTNLEDRTKAQIDEFKNLMKQAQYEFAQQEAQVMISERTAAGLNIPAEAYASYRIGQQATNLREVRELKRLRENNYLLAMMQTEKSFVPYPDEPPVHFPPATVWRELTGKRVERYGPYSLGEGAPQSLKRMRSVLEGEVDKRVNIKNLQALDLQTMLTQLTEEFKEYGVRFVYRLDLLGDAFKPADIKLKTPNDLTGLPLGAFLDTVLRDIDYSWVARPDYIEIGPMLALRYDEKVTKVFDVAELIIGIPQSVNQATLFQNLQFLGAQATIFGAAFNPFAGAGFNGGGNFQGFNGGGFPGGQGGFPGGQGGFPGGQGGFPGGQGGAGQGIGGGLPQGGQGNPNGGLSGQFGIQGNDQSSALLQILTSVVARGEWDLQMVGGVQQPLFNQNVIDAAQPGVDARQLNSLGYYPPARALIIRGSHRYHMSPSFKLKKGADAMGAGGPGLPGRGQIANNVPANPNNVRAIEQDPKAVAKNLIAKAGKDSDKVWNEAFDKTITQPTYIVAAFEALYENNEFVQATEALKAGIRKGRTTGAWAQEALAIALQSSQASPAEVERAMLSNIDLEPNDAQAFLKAAKGESDLGRPEVALAYCQRAALLEPNLALPYANALAYAEKSGEVKADVIHWATENLLRRDWSNEGIDYHKETKERVSAIAKKLTSAGRMDDAQKLNASLNDDKVRDLMIELRYQGVADLDLIVKEPTGGACTSTHKRTTGGGVLQSDILEQENSDRSELYTAAEAFPGVYEIQVKTVLGKPISNRATLVITKFAGTDRQEKEVLSVDLSNAKPLQVTMTGGRRKELVAIPQDNNLSSVNTMRAPATAAGFSGGVAGSLESNKSMLPVVHSAQEASFNAPGSGLPGFRVEAKLSPDRQKLVYQASPVFTGPATDLPMPKINLLPGGE